MISEFVPAHSYICVCASTLEQKASTRYITEQHYASVSFFPECWWQVAKWIYLISTMCERILICVFAKVCVCTRISHHMYFYTCVLCGLTYLFVYVCSCVCARTHFQFPRLPPSQPMHTLILLDLVGLDQKLLTKGKQPSA